MVEPTVKFVSWLGRTDGYEYHIHILFEVCVGMVAYAEAPDKVVKRNGTVVDFDRNRILNALINCFNSINRIAYEAPNDLVDRVINLVGAKYKGVVPTVEQIQDAVELVLQSAGEFDAAKHYILYRNEHTKKREAEYIPPEIRQAFENDKQYFPTQLQYFQYLDKYARFNYGTGRRETWVETVDRVVSFLHELASHYADLGSETYERIRRGILEHKVMPSMRLMASAGEAARRDNVSIYNCAYGVIDSIDSFCDLMAISMAGGGVGYSVESKYVDKLPVVKTRRNTPPLLHIVEDSAVGWVNALREGLESWIDGYNVDFNFDFVRLEGSVLRTKGGRASGPKPLIKLLDFIHNRIRSREGKKLRPIDVHDIACAIGNAVVSGGVRRTALISLFDREDTDMMQAKIGNFELENNQRWNANNSFVLTNVDNYKQADFMHDFYTTWYSSRGEPGIFNREAAYNLIPTRRDHGYEFGSNPCFGAGTLIHTKNGHFPVESLIGKTVDIWNGENWQQIDNFRVTGQNQQVIKLTLQDGSVLRLTPYHTCILEDKTRIQVKDLNVGMKLLIASAPEVCGDIEESGAYAKGFLLVEGTHTSDRPVIKIYEPKYSCIERLLLSLKEIIPSNINTNAVTNVDIVEDTEYRLGVSGLACRKEELIDWVTSFRQKLPYRVFNWSYNSKIEFLAGLFDGDGTASDTSNGFMYQLSNVNKDLLLDIQALLKTIGVYSKLSLMKEAGTKNFNDGYGEYNTKDCWRLTLNQKAAKALALQVPFSRLVSFADKKLTYTLKQKFNEIVKIENDGIDEEVYCCTVEGSHSLALTNGIHIGQCGEIILRPDQFCNLSTVVARSYDTVYDLEEKVELASIIGTIQSLATNFPFLSKTTWKQNCEDERLLGVSIGGQYDYGNAELSSFVFTFLKDHVIKTNKLYAEKLGINQSAATTCVKPDGNSSTLLDMSSGAHPRWAPYYIRRVRVTATSAIAKVLKDAGMVLTPENGNDPVNPSVLVASFPVKAPPGSITRNDVTAIQQCEWWLLNKKYWTEHNPSITITYGPEEVIDLMVWQYKHLNEIGGMTILPRDDAKYDQLPYEEIDENTYNEMVAAMPDIDWARIFLYEKEDFTVAAQTLACVAAQCEVP